MKALLLILLLCPSLASATPLLTPFVYQNLGFGPNPTLTVDSVPVLEPTNERADGSLDYGQPLMVHFGILLHEASSGTIDASVFLNNVLMAHEHYLMVNPSINAGWGIGLVLDECCYTPRDGRLDLNVTGFAPASYAFQVAQPIPEPGTLFLFGSGVFAAWRRRLRPCSLHSA